VRWCLLRGETDLRPASHDLDLLVAPEDLTALAAAVRPLGFAAVPTPARGSHQFFVSYLSALDRWMILDVVTELSFGPAYVLRTRAAAGCLARRERHGSVVVPSDDDAFWALLLHRLLDRDGSFRAQDRQRLQRLVRGARPDGALAGFAAAICPGDADPVAMVAAVRRGEWSALSRLGEQLLETWRRKHRAQYLVRSVIASVAWRLGPRVAGVALPGLRVAIVAEDAATARDQATALARSFYLPVSPLDVVEPPGPRDGAGAVARRLPASAALWFCAHLHQLDGRLVALPVAAPASERADVAIRAAAPGFRAQLVFDIRRGGVTERAPGRQEKPPEGRYLSVRGIPLQGTKWDGTPDRDSERRSVLGRELTAGLWRAYCERRG
jgi:hypothetical protein